jgi:hypothetical protein
MDILVLLAALGGVGVGWRLCAELRRIRETLDGIAFTHAEILYQMQQRSYSYTYPRD